MRAFQSISLSLLSLISSISSLSFAWGSKAASEASTETQAMSQNTPNGKTDPDKAPRVPGQYLISFTQESTSQERDALLETVGAQMIEKVGSTPLFLIEISKDVENALKKLRQNPSVRYVEPNFKLSTFGEDSKP